MIYADMITFVETFGIGIERHRVKWALAAICNWFGSIQCLIHCHMVSNRDPEKFVQKKRKMASQADINVSIRFTMLCQCGKDLDFQQRAATARRT